MNEQIVEMGQLGCTTDAKTLLVTRGISTCIAFVMHGTFFDEDDNLKAFCALFHWQGFYNKEEDPIGHVETVLETFLQEIREHLKLDEDEEINIDRLQFIGGEKKQCDNLGKAIVSGTEDEVKALIAVLKTFDFAEYSYSLKNDITHYHFLTKDESTIEVQVQLTHSIFTIEDDAVSSSLPEYLGPKF